MTAGENRLYQRLIKDWNLQFKYQDYIEYNFDELVKIIDNGKPSQHKFSKDKYRVRSIIKRLARRDIITNTESSDHIEDMLDRSFAESRGLSSPNDDIDESAAKTEKEIYSAYLNGGNFKIYGKKTIIRFYWGYWFTSK